MTTKTIRRKSSRGFRLAINWPLWLGILFVGTIAYLAYVGPDIAPKDPSEENLIVKDPVTGEWHVPPFPAFSVTGFPLGSDEFGRDIYSRLLHGVRPTLQMVLLVAGVRLVLGTLIGLVAGYSVGKIGSFFDTLISSALALPGLLVALGAIAIVGVELGVLAFIIGLSITGWAETARLVREQTRAVRKEIYVEAAYAMGATDAEIVFRHVLRQIRSMLLMLLAFEVGSTLMLTAGLGFLGYYIGGDVWVDVEDFVARRTSGTPELGQMLATAWVRLTDPWGLVSIGSVVFIAVLGFNLIGEGLRLRLSPELQMMRIRWVTEIMAKARLNIEQALYPISRFLFGSRVAVAGWYLLLGIALGYGGVSAWQAGVFDLPEAQTNMFFEERSRPTATPGPGSTSSGADEGSDNAQTISAEPIGETSSSGNAGDFQMPTVPVPITDPVTYWTLEDESGFEGNPAVDAQGNVYAAGLGGEVYAIRPDGTVLWQRTLDPAPAFSPTLSPDGVLYVPDKAGGIAALSLDGDDLWYFSQTDEGIKSVSQVVLNGTDALYYTISRGTSGQVQAVSKEGSSLWRTRANTSKFYRAPNVSATGEYVFLANDIFDSVTGEIIELASEFPPDTFFAGANNRDYMVSGTTVFEWQRTGDAIEVLKTIRASGVEPQFGTVISPLKVHVTAAEHVIFFFRWGVLWQDSEGEIIQEAGGGDRQFLVLPLSVETDEAALACGQDSILFGPSTEICLSFGPESETKRWEIRFAEVENLVDSLAGAARTPSGFVFASRTGMLYGAMETEIAEALTAKKAAEELEGTAITATGSGWIFNTPTNLLVDPLIHENGSIYLLTDSNRFYVLDNAGNVQITLELPEPIYILEETFFGGGTFGTPFPPLLTPDGGLVVASSTRLYHLNLDGTIDWEIPLDDEPHSPPVTGFIENTYYLLDKQGSLYAFHPSDGLVWKHDLEEGLRPAYFFPVFSSNGNVYYSITNGTRGQIEALAPDGTQLWRTVLTTFNFYRPIRITPAGDWISLDDNVVRTDSGELVELVDTEFPIDQFSMGQDGKTYLLSGSTIMEWTLLPGGRLNVVRQVTIAFPPNATRGLPPRLSVTEDGTIWIVFVQAGGRSLIYDWINFEGTVLNQISVDTADGFVIEEDLANVGLTVCTLERTEENLVCAHYDSNQPDPQWTITIQGIPRADSVQYFDGTLYIQTASDTLQTVDVEFPTE